MKTQNKPGAVNGGTALWFQIGKGVAHSLGHFWN